MTEADTSLQIICLGACPFGVHTTTIFIAFKGANLGLLRWAVPILDLCARNGLWNRRTIFMTLVPILLAVSMVKCTPSASYSPLITLQALAAAVVVVMEEFDTDDVNSLPVEDVLVFTFFGQALLQGATLVSSSHGCHVVTWTNFTRARASLASTGVLRLGTLQLAGPPVMFISSCDDG